MANGTERQTLLADIEIAKADLYVFKESKERQKWEDLLAKAVEATEADHYVYARKLIDRVNEVVSKLWGRIFRWQEIQRKITAIFLIAIPIELIGICVYIHFLNILAYPIYSSMIFGLLGGSLGVALSIGKDLQIDGSNRLQMLRLLFRPFVGVISAIVLFMLLNTGLLSILPSADPASTLVLTSIFAGFSERFVVTLMSDYVPKVFK